MDHGARMGVAEVVDIGAGGVEEGRAQGIDALGSPDQGCLLAAGESGERAQRHLTGAARSPQGDRKEIHQGTLGLKPHPHGDVIPSRSDNKAGQGPR